MTTQEAYETMREYFSRPGAVLAKSSSGACKYRLDGNKCAVGSLIPDELYDPVLDSAMYGSSVRSILSSLQFGGEVAATLGEERAQALHEILDDDANKVHFLVEAQVLHDSCALNAADFVRRLDGLALRYYLKVVDA